MCLSRIGQIAYGGFALASVGLILGSIFTPAWRQVASNLQQGQLGQLPPLNMGLFAFACQRSSDNTQSAYNGNVQSGTVNQGYNTANQGFNTANQQGYGTTNTNYNTNYGNQQPIQQVNSGSTAITVSTQSGTRYLDLCIEMWNNQPLSEKIVIVLMILGLITAIGSFIWNLLTICACFCHGSILKPLPGLSFSSFVFTLVAVIIYWSRNNSSINQLQSITSIQSLNSQSDLSYSFYLACGSAVASLANVIVGTLVVFLADKCI
ncbi:unnamed protein product [Meloidogyne enterolobii]|uniref:Uncharacterized protein n=1 Tax=Meloidogyne enterolobii TaxID=390850 RepID=A0ACB0XSB6_MELEN